MFEIDGLKGGEARICGKGALRRDLAKNGLVTACIILTMIALSSAQLEYEPGEREAEILFEMGLGGPWIMSEKHPESYGIEVPTWPSTSEFSIYSEYFSLTAPTGMEVDRYYISGTPDIYATGPGGKPISGSYYQTYFPGAESLWILGARSWTGYAIVPQGAYLRLVAYSPGGGWATFYEITPAEKTVQKRLSIYTGYSLLTFRAEELGRYLLLFSVGDEISNAVVVDVRRGTWPASPPGPGTVPQGYGSARVTLESTSLKGYSVYLDGSRIGADGWGGDVRDGIYTFTVPGDRWHTIRASGSGITCTFNDYYESGRSYTIELCYS
ncbi:hypothetical protein P0O24_10885 [Methanotrichaceae archaeon M04Ac]|uniref:PEGA domain-containing protein n=1 Tax=Candidatus Methanocrinis alkalitolerans TaxID=3033395 RepID=A0ABT5XHE8_9EURY|nr:hypothetical protein [Candidatus Methanocrinis alkalitolerans]MDF0594085.1 hypothetical protein [Candidatus Methanocrinis alkalitolerans]